jgi:hypothetical protein
MPDVTIMIPTLELSSVLLHQVTESILMHPIVKLVVVASGPNFQQETEAFTEAISDPRIQLLHSIPAGRRRKTAPALSHIKTSLVVAAELGNAQDQDGGEVGHDAIRIRSSHEGDDFHIIY